MAEAKQMMVGNQLVNFKDEQARTSIEEILLTIEQIVSSLEAGMQTIEDLTTSNDNQNEIISGMERQFTGMQTNISTNTNTIAGLETSVVEAQTLVESLNAEVARLKTSLSAYDTKINAKIDASQITSDLNETSETKVASAKALNDLYQQMDESGLAVIDSLDSTSTTSPLSANQGRIVNEKATTNSSNISTLQTAVSGLDVEVTALRTKISYGTELPSTLDDGKIFMLIKE